MALEDAFVNLYNSFILWLPSMIAAVLTLFVGFLLGRFIGWITKKLILRSKIDDWISEEEEKLSFRFSDVLSTVAKWFIYLVFLQQAALFLGVAAITSFINNVLIFIPSLVEAALVIIVGYTLAGYLKDRIISSKTMYADITGKLIFFTLLYLSIALALPFVGINPTLVNNILLVVVAALGLGVAIAIGLGAKDAVAELTKGYARRYSTPKKRK